jgi:hypothetical protein
MIHSATRMLYAESVLWCRHFNGISRGISYGVSDNVGFGFGFGFGFERLRLAGLVVLFRRNLYGLACWILHRIADDVGFRFCLIRLAHSSSCGAWVRRVFQMDRFLPLFLRWDQRWESILGRWRSSVTHASSVCYRVFGTVIGEDSHFLRILKERNFVSSEVQG